MQAPYKKDKNARHNFILYENKVRCFKALKINTSLSTSWWARYKLSSLPARSYKNRCLVSNKGNSIRNDFKLSRNILKSWAQAQKLPGVVKASW